MSSMKKVHLIGNAHLDPVWLWRWQEGYAEIKATFRSALDRMNEFPDFIFTCSCAAYYRWIEQSSPEMFEEIRQRITEGRWVIVGGWWIQPDCNIPSGESFVRQGLYSQRYFHDKFGIISKVGYNVDSFGHNVMLPQILKKSGMNYYVFMRPSDKEKELPEHLFWWESPDGSKVMAYKIPYSYGNWFSEGDDPVCNKAEKIMEMAKEKEVDMMCFYGVGNHGGGPTIENIRTIQKMQAKNPKFIFSSPDLYFKEILKQQNRPITVVKDDLQHHASGCYSAHSEIKKLNRRAEHRLISAEKFASVTESLFGRSYPADALFKGWEKVMFNQFHDILAGCSIKEAYEDAKEFYGHALTLGAEVINSAVQKISWNINTMGDKTFSLSKDMDWMLWEMGDEGVPFVVFNPLSWEVNAPIQVNKSVSAVTDEEGSPIEIQKVRASQTNGKDKWDTLFVNKIPAMGYRVFWIHLQKSFENPNKNSSVTVTEEGILENTCLLVEFEQHTGQIKRLYDKTNRMEVLAGHGAVPIVIDEFDSDTWAHGIFEFKKEVARFSDAEIKVIESGPVRAVIRIISRYNSSVLQQDFLMYPDRNDIEVYAKLDWREQHKMLKLSFPVNVRNPEAVYEIPYGFINKPVNGEEEPGQQWLDVFGEVNYSSEVKDEEYKETHNRENPNGDGGSNQYGLAILNDCKYSFNVKGNDLRMTIIRSPVFADHFGEKDEFCDYMDQGIHEFKYIIMPHREDWKSTDVVRRAYELNVPTVKINETYHKGCLPLKFEGIRISAGNIIATVFKQSEDRNGYILRCYETNGCDTITRIEIPFLDREWTANFAGCEIKTFYIPKEQNDKSGIVTEVSLIEMEL